jgi:hypothetical protein
MEQEIINPLASAFFWVSLSRSILFILIALLLIKLGLGYFDRRLGINFKKDVFDVLKTEPVALAWYFAMRILGFCLVGMAAILGSV